MSRTPASDADEESVLRERPARWTKSVPVQRRAHARAVRERHGGGSVPRFHQRGVVFVERADVVPHVVLRAPRLRNEHHHRVRGVASSRHQQLEHVVQRGGVGLRPVDERQDLPDVDPAGRLVRERQRRLARGERVEVALDGVDLAVVRDGAERMRELPGREGVRRIALVDDGERRDEVRVRKIRIEPLDLRREEESLVHDRPGRARADVGVAGRLLDLAADDVEAVLEGGVGRASASTRRDEELPYPRHNGSGVLADGAGIHRNVAPRQDLAALGPHGVLDLPFLAHSAEDHRDAEGVRPFAILRLREGEDLPEESVRNLEQQSRAVARLGVVAGRAAVHEPLEHRHALHDDVVARLAVEARHHADAARIVFVFAAIESLPSGSLPGRNVFALHGSVTFHTKGMDFPLAMARTTSDAPDAQSPTQ